MQYQLVYDGDVSPVFDTFGEAYAYLEENYGYLFSLYKELQGWDGRSFSFGVDPESGEDITIEILSLTEQEASYAVGVLE